jgi:hypothetical protein
MRFPAVLTYLTLATAITASALLNPDGGYRPMYTIECKTDQYDPLRLRDRHNRRCRRSRPSHARELRLLSRLQMPALMQRRFRFQLRLSSQLLEQGWMHRGGCEGLQAMLGITRGHSSEAKAALRGL